MTIYQGTMDEMTVETGKDALRITCPACKHTNTFRGIAAGRRNDVDIVHGDDCEWLAVREAECKRLGKTLDDAPCGIILPVKEKP